MKRRLKELAKELVFGGQNLPAGQILSLTKTKSERQSKLINLETKTKTKELQVTTDSSEI